MARATANPQTPNLAAVHHPLYDQFQAEWIKLGHVREGTGGFADGTYLIGHPREYVDHTQETPIVPTKKLKTRRRLARYDNLAATILETKKSALFRTKPYRRVGTGDPGSSELEQWWEDVDGQGHSIDSCMRAWWDLGATFGHVALYFELPDEETETPVICTYTPLDVLNWVTDRYGIITIVALAEAIPPETLDQVNATSSRVRVVTDSGWTTYGRQGRSRTMQPQEMGTHNLGVLPVVYLFGKRRAIFPDVGQSVLGDPRLHIDLFNLISEDRELLRNQTFSMINVPLGTGADAINVETAKAMLGETVGTSNVMFSATAASMLSADASNVTSYQDEIEKLKRAIYRESGTPYESDSKDAEAQGSLELKREDLNVRLAAYADECEAAEYGLAELWYRARYGDTWETKWDADEVTIHYPDKFTAETLDDQLEQVQAAQGIGMPPEVLKRLRIGLLDKFEGLQNLTPDERTLLEDAINAAADDVTPAEQAKAQLKQTMQGGPKIPRKVA